MLEAGIDWRPELGAHTKPIGRETPIDVARLPESPRQSADGTVYCVACPRSLRLSPRSQKILCSDCTAQREAFRARRHRVRRSAIAAADATRDMVTVRVRVDDTHLLIDAISDLQAAVGAALARKGRAADEWQERLLLAAKHVDVSADCLRTALANSTKRPESTA